MHPNLNLIDQFFAAYGKRDLAGLQGILAEDATWTFPRPPSVKRNEARN